MKYENLMKIINDYLNKEEHWLVYDEYSRNRSYSWRTVNFYHNIELPLKEDLKPFEKTLNDMKKTINKIEKKEDTQSLIEFKEELIKQFESYKVEIQTLKNILKSTYKDLKEDISTQEQHLLLRQKVLDNFQDYFDLYKKSTIKGKELSLIHI